MRNCSLRSLLDFCESMVGGWLGGAPVFLEYWVNVEDDGGGALLL